VTSFIEVKIILDRLVNGDEIRMHGNFWRGKTRDELVALKVMGLPLVAVLFSVGFLDAWCSTHTGLISRVPCSAVSPSWPL